MREELSGRQIVEGLVGPDRVVRLCPGPQGRAEAREVQGASLHS